MDRLSIYLLGSFSVRQGDQILTGVFRTRKERALLAYLAIESRQMHRREAVAEMLWPERPEGYARTNLRQALVGLRRAIGEQYILVTDEMVQFQPARALWLDTDAFRAAYARTLTHTHTNPESCAECASSLQAAVELYRGDFLADVYLSDAQGFQEWSIFHREQHFRNLLSALHSLSIYYQQGGDYEQSHQYAWRYVNLAPLEETAHRQLMTVQVLSGRRGAALEQYHACRSLLARELGVEPTAETQDLYETIRLGRASIERPAQGAAAIANNLPAGLTSFFGRENELARIEECLLDPACRLISLVGMPGAGKTRLALQAARRRLESFPDGVWHTALGTAGGRLAEKLLTSLGVTVLLEMPKEEQLLTRLKGMRCLLVVDNFENYLDETGLLIEILKRAPGLKILLTSQERLNYQSACVFHIRGLPCGQGGSLETAQESPTVRLFLARAQHTRSGFALSEENLAQVVAICSKVEGLPLALELAAAALRDYRSEEIAAMLDEGLEVLNTSMLDLPADHRSMQAALERPWLRLSPAQQALLCRLTGLDGDFVPSQAGASQGELDDLADRSLLDVGLPGRFRLHPLVRLFLKTKVCREEVQKATGLLELLDRSMFWDRLEHLLERSARYGQTAAVVMVRLEEDDQLPAGQIGAADQELLRRLRSCLRKSDTALLMDRGVFGIILEDISHPEDSLKVAQKVCEALSVAIVLEGVEYLPLAHMGISIYPRDAQQAGKLIECAEAAMRLATQAGNCCRMYG